MNASGEHPAYPITPQLLEQIKAAMSCNAAHRLDYPPSKGLGHLDDTTQLVVDCAVDTLKRYVPLWVGECCQALGWQSKYELQACSAGHATLERNPDWNWCWMIRRRTVLPD